MTVEYIKRDYEGQSLSYNNQDYYRVEVESYDPNNIIFRNANTGWSGTNLKIEKSKDETNVLTGNNKNNTVNIRNNYNVLESGAYRVHIKGYSTTTNSSIELRINNQLTSKISTRAVDVNYKTWDLGLININKGNNNLNLIFNGNVQVLTVYLLKIRKTSGDANNNGSIVILNADTAIQSSGEMQTLTLTMLNSDNIYENGGFLEEGNSTGLIFEYRDHINFYIKNVFGQEDQVFGGYISSAILSEDKLTIDITAVNRLKDYHKQSMIKELNIGDDITSQLATYNCQTPYEALKYVCGNIETPATPINIDALKNEVVYKEGYQQNLALASEQRGVITQNMTRGFANSYLCLQNDAVYNNLQRAVLKQNLNVNIKDYPIFFMNYGMGPPVTEEEKLEYLPKDKKPTINIKKPIIVPIDLTKVKKKSTVATSKVKIAKTKKVAKTKPEPAEPETVGYKYGYDVGKPFLCWVEVEFSLTPNGVRHKVNVNFTGHTTDQVAGSIKPVLANNRKSKGEINLYNVLKVMYPSSDNFYLKKLSLVGRTPPGPVGEMLYDWVTDDSVYKMNFYNWGLRDGYDAVVPEILASSGKTYLDLMNEIGEMLNLSPQMVYAPERRLDKINFDKNNDEIALLQLTEGVSGNILGVESLTYTPVQKLFNSILKVYKNTSGNYEYVKEQDLNSIYRYGVHEDLEVLSDECGPFFAKYLAKIDVSKSTTLDFTYALPVAGYLNLRLGLFVECVFNNHIYNDVKEIKSISIRVDVKEAYKVVTTFGLDDINPLILAKNNIDKMRQLTESKRRLFSGGAVKIY